MRATCTIRLDPVYRRDAFVNGLKRAGFTLADNLQPKTSQDWLVIWNRYGTNEARADDWEKDGGTVLVAENGYIGRYIVGRQYYALAVHGHNGSGWFPIGSEDRFLKLGIPLLPWVDRPDGYALICGQRGIGSRTMASPPNWHVQAQKYIGKSAPTKVRLHPGNKPPVIRLEDDLAGANRCVVWSSAAGVTALTLGIPVQYDAPRWICEHAATPMREPLTLNDERPKALNRMAWGQWSVAELEGGEPFVRIREQIGEAKW